MIVYEVFPGQEITNTCKIVCEMATKHEQDVQFTFNGVMIVAQPDSDPKNIHQNWVEKTEADRKKYLASPEYAEKKKEDEKRERLNAKRYEVLTNKILRFKSKYLAREEIQLLSEWCILADCNYIDKEANKEVAEKLIELGFVDIEDISKEMREEANKGEGYSHAKLECVIGNIIQMILSGPTGTPHQVSSHFLNQLSQ